MRSKTCSRCAKHLPEENFHRQGSRGRHSWCKRCFNEYNKQRRSKRPPEYWRRRNFVARYGITEADARAMLKEQGGCAICGEKPARPCVDHCHDTGTVRGILCHGCNIKLAALEDAEFRGRAIRYLGLEP